MIIIRDNKEKTGWDFDFHDATVVDQSLKTGDYTVKGYETSIVIERKASTGEIAANLGLHKKRFEREFERFQDFQYRFLICEFPFKYYNDFPQNSKIPESKWPKLRINGGYMAKTIVELCNKYDVQAYYCNSRDLAESMAFNLLTEAVREINGEQAF